jgi:Uma2 family endonuclease
MGGFLKYLAEDARRYLKEDGELLAMGSATGYASAVNIICATVIEIEHHHQHWQKKIGQFLSGRCPRQCWFRGIERKESRQ